MRQFQFASSLRYAVIAILFASCGGGDNKKDNGTGADTTAAPGMAADTPQEVNTIVTTPQNMMIVTHKVTDYTKWLSAYEAHDSVRLAFGAHNYVLGRGVTDTNMILIALKVDDIAKAKAFSKDPGLKKAMQKAGVIGNPNISLTVANYQDTAKISSDMRSRTTFTVKDWDAWQKAFTQGRQERLDNGLVERVYGHDPDDNKKVTLVVAITDTAKAAAYWKSDALKKRRAASGVTTEPQRFLFRIVKRY